MDTSRIAYRTETIDGIDVFYREAGDPSLPKLVLLGGFPASSHQFRLLMPLLAGRFHVVSPDYPGFGNTSMPPRDEYDYTFDRAAEVIEGWLDAIGFDRFGLYVQDYGGPIGFRIVGRRPERLEWLVVQNSNAYEEGFTAVWDGIRGDYWADRNAETEGALLPFLSLDGIRDVYLTGHPDPSAVSPDNWNMDLRFMDRPGARDVQLDYLYDYKTNPPLYPVWQAFLRERQPKTVIFWGQGDIFFTPEGGEAFLRDLPDAEIHRLDSGHFVVEDHAQTVADGMVAFYDREVAGGGPPSEMSAAVMEDLARI